ncbi:MAG TPA: HAMP domain-containing sensor histidine kinase [Thermoanaerobaculia bacterium]|nr:HAMP domain-containing sensor histidine kinase [Thermoanaerobaculia bacterium]
MALRRRLRRAGLPAPLPRRTLWLGFAAVLAPLAILLALQYRWLVELERASAATREAALRNYLEAVAGEVELYYAASAERTLNVPAHVFTQDRLDKVAAHFKKKPPEGARRLFVVSFVGEASGKPLFFDPACGDFAPAPWTPELRAVLVATSGWQTLAHKGGVVDQVAPTVEERDPAHRILLNPITDDASRVVGVAGMVLDERWFAETLLPGAIAKALPKYLGDPDRLRDPDALPVVTVADGAGRRVYSTVPGRRDAPEVERPLAFVFTDWRVGLASRHPHAGDWARGNFLLNVGLSAALALALTGGVVLALRTASREMRLSQMKSDFVSNVSHELRTPLASIRVFGELLRLGRIADPRKVHEYGEYIETESRRLTGLIDNLLDFAHIESGRESYRLEPGDLGEVVAEALDGFELRLRQSGFRLTWRPPAGPLPPVAFDPAAIAHALANLLDNAVKYSGDAREIEVTLGRRGGEAVLAVRDWGIGIPKDEHEKIFDRFHRVSTGLVHDVKGTGLGLSIVRHVVAAHGGRVEVESRPGQGSRFAIVLPLAAPAGEPAAEPAAGELVPGEGVP